MINQTVLGYADLSLRGQDWRAYGLQTADGVISCPAGASARGIARAAAERVVIPLSCCCRHDHGSRVDRIAGCSLARPREVQRRDARSLAPLGATICRSEIAPLVGELNRLLEPLQRLQRAAPFISDAAELRSPLTALRLQLQLLDRAPDQPARVEARSRLGSAVERAIHLVEQLLALARSEPQETPGDFQPVDLSAAAADGIADNHDLALTRNIDLSLDAPQKVLIRGDREALRTLVRNLVDNAVRYTPSGGSVQVRCRGSNRKPCSRSPIRVPGLPWRIANGSSTAFSAGCGPESGSGLGLAIVKAIAERHHARIQLDDAPGGGLRVAVTYPRGS